METLVGAHTDFRGTLQVQGTIRIDGRVDGQVSAHCVILSETALAKGEITAQRTLVGGTIEGILRSREVEIKATGRVLGEIFTHTFSVSAGGKFNGKIDMQLDGSNVLLLQSKAQEG